MKATQAVTVRRQSEIIATYEPLPPDRNPMFFEKRVYQGSSGKVYPLPFFDRISTERRDHKWDAIYIENEFVQVMLLPEIGGRIHAILDKTNGYDTIYKQAVIKPALVGLAGPWASGGIEFNWPQHHRPSTFMPTDVSIEEHADGSKTVWMSEHEPMNRMKGMHGVCIHPGKAYVELKVRLHNRTPIVQTFLWWANVATRVHDRYQSFFPPDVHFVADHARRAMSSYPLCRGRYYGVDYAQRARQGEAHARLANDLSWYANIPVPTSYMCLGSNQDFFGGYDHAAQAGIIHVADHHIAPGKKQWTWGNHEFGYAWDRQLSDDRAPYIEIMAGVYTDNQPDFSFLMPGETRTFSQFWYPIQRIGPAIHANRDAAISLKLNQRQLQIGVASTSVFENATIRLQAKKRNIWNSKQTLAPDAPLVTTIKLPSGVFESDLRVTVHAADGRLILNYPSAADDSGADSAKRAKNVAKIPSPATEPPPPERVNTIEELYLIGLHLEQYRHATRLPELYWRQALRRDPSDARCNNAMGLWHYRRGEFEQAEKHFRLSIARLTTRNSNPYDGEPYYNLGLALRALGQYENAYDAFYKSTWTYAWQSAAFLALAEIDCRHQNWPVALEHLNQALRVNVDHLWGRNLKAIVLRKLNRRSEATELLQKTLELDPLDLLARWLLWEQLSADSQTRLDLALDLGRAGFFDLAVEVLRDAPPDAGSVPLVNYYRAYFCALAGQEKPGKKYLKDASSAPPDYCFPSRLEEIQILESAIRADPRDARASYYLGNLLYDRRRHPEAIAAWERSIKLDDSFATCWRNLGIGYFNIVKNPSKARFAYDRAFAADPGDARICFERDQLWKRCGISPKRRLKELEKYPHLIQSRDDLSIEICSLYNLLGQHDRALAILELRQFQPWEGGEGKALGAYVRARLALGKQALENRDFCRAIDRFDKAIDTPPNLGEVRHLLANSSDVHYFSGLAAAGAGDRKLARQHWKTAAEFKGDFQSMSIRAFSEMTFYSALALRQLGRNAAAIKLLQQLLAHARSLAKSEAKIDYFATSLPAMLLFDEDIQARQQTDAKVLQAQALFGLGRRDAAKKILHEVLRRDPAHAIATELLHDISRQSRWAWYGQSRAG